MATDPIRAAITTFAEELAALIRAAVVDDIRAAIRSGARQSQADAIVSRPRGRRLLPISVAGVPSPARPRGRPGRPPAGDTWPVAGTNAHIVLEALRARANGMNMAELLKATRIHRKPLGKAMDKLRERGRVRTEGARGRVGMRYLAA